MQPIEEPVSNEAPASLVEQDADGESDEEQAIRRWRFDQFVHLGFDYVTSAMLADARVDLNEVRKLIALGCPCETASRIVL